MSTRPRLLLWILNKDYITLKSDGTHAKTDFNKLKKGNGGIGGIKIRKL